jgi:hypothetical protein
MENTVITQALAEYKPIEAEIQKSLPNTDDYLINGVFDDDGYKAAKSALRQAKSVVSSIETKRKELKAIALEYGRAVDGKAKELAEVCQPTINTLSERIAAVDMEKERLRNEQRDKRTKELIAAGYEYVHGAYRIGDQVVHTSAIDSASDEDWAGIIERGKEAAERVRLETERLAKERAALEAERAALEAERAALAKERLESAPQPEPAAPTAPAASIPAEFISSATPSKEYIDGFNACRTLCIEIVKRSTQRRQIISDITDLEP